MDATPTQVFMLALAEKLSKGDIYYMSKEEAREHLCRMTGQDFGFDVDQWREWLKGRRSSRVKAKKGRRPGVRSEVSATPTPADSGEEEV